MFRSVKWFDLFQFPSICLWCLRPSMVSTSCPVSAPANDLRFLRQLTEYRHPEIRQTTTTAFHRHPWYLSEITVGLAFFDANIEFAEKEKNGKQFMSAAWIGAPTSQADIS